MTCYFELNKNNYNIKKEEEQQFCLLSKMKATFGGKEYILITTRL